MSVVDQAKSALSSFFRLWNNYPSFFNKASDITFAKWSNANTVNPSSVDYTGTGFSSLNSSVVSSYNVPFTINNSTYNTSLKFINVRINGQTMPDMNVTINPATTTKECKCPSYSCRSFNKDYDRGTYTSGEQCYASCGSMTNFRTVAYHAYGIGKVVCSNIATPQTTSTSITISLGQAAVVGSVSFVVLFADNASAPITINGTTYTGNYSQTFLSVSGLLTDFQILYTVLLIDFYTSLINLYTNNPIVSFAPPNNKPSNSSTDRTNALVGTNVANLQAQYISYLTDLYAIIYTQNKSLIDILTAVWNVMTVTDKSPFVSLNIDADISTFAGFTGTSQPATLIQNLIQLASMFNKYRNQGVLLSFNIKNAMEEYYKNTYMPCLRYLTKSDGQLAAIQTAAQKSTTYWLNSNGSVKSSFAALASGDTYTSLGTVISTGLTTLVDKLVQSYSSTQQKYMGFGMITTSATVGMVPTVTNANAVTTRTTYIGATYWPQLIMDIMAFVKGRISATSYLRGWASKLSTESIGATSTPVSLPATTGLGLKL